MTTNTWPLKKPLPHGHRFITKSGLMEVLDMVDDDTPIWINNYWQPIRQITQRPVDLIAIRPDGLHIA